MTGFLLDANVVLELIKPKPHRGVVSWVADADEILLHFSVLTLGEIRKGIVAQADAASSASAQVTLVAPVVTVTATSGSGGGGGGGGGALDGASLLLALWLVPAVVAGGLLGERLFPLASEKFYRRLALTLLVAVAIGSLIL